MDAEASRLVLVAIGVTGVGKSSACNAIAGADFAAVSSGFASATSTCGHMDATVDGTPLRVVDTVGFLDNRMTEAEKQAKFGEFANAASFGVDAFLLTFKDGRFTEQDERSFKLFTQLAGKDSLKFTILMFTHVKDAELQAKLRGDNVPRELAKILEQIAWRVVGVDSVHCKEEAASKVLSATRDLVARNGGLRFSNKALAVAQRQREVLQRRIDALESPDRRQVLTEMRQGMNNGSQSLESVQKAVEEAEAEEARVRAQVASLEGSAQVQEEGLLQEHRQGQAFKRRVKLFGALGCLVLLVVAALAFCWIKWWLWRNDYCSQHLCLSAVHQLGWGFDILTGQMPSKPFPVVKLSFSGATHANPYDSSFVWHVPDQFTVVPHAQLETSSVTEVSYSAEDFAQYRARGIQIEAGLNFSGSPLSISAGVMKAHSFLSQRQSYSSYTHSTVFGTLFQVSLKNGHVADDSFLAAVKQLPKDYVASAYKDFLAEFGTHYMTAGYFGGSGEMATAVNAHYGQRHREDWVAQQADIHYKFLQAGATGEDASSDFLGDGDYHSAISSVLIGGDPQLVGKDLSLWQKWVQSWYKNPTLVFKDTFPVTLRTVETLISDSHIKANVQRAIDEYASQHPYPEGPGCQGKVLNPDGQCCEQDTPDSCDHNCYNSASSTCCSAGHLCSAGQSCCGNGCTGAGYDCCSDGGACPPGQKCCTVDGGTRTFCIPYDGNCCQTVWCSDSGVCCDQGGYHWCCQQQSICCFNGVDHWCCADTDECWPTFGTCGFLGLKPSLGRSSWKEARNASLPVAFVPKAEFV